MSGLGAADTVLSLWDRVEACLRKHKIDVSFGGGKTTVIKPVYVRQNDRYYYIDPASNCHDSHQYELALQALNRELNQKQQFDIPFFINNIGKTPIEEYRLDFTFDGVAQILGLDDLSQPKDKALIQCCEDSVSFESASRKPIVQHDTRAFSLRIVPERDAKYISVKWKIFAKDYTDEGALKIYVNPEYHNLANIYMEYQKRDDMPLMEDLPAETKRIKELTAELQNKSDN